MHQRNASISKGIDWTMVILYIALAVVGLLCIFSVEYKSGDNVMQSFLGFKKEYSKQLYFLMASLVIASFILLTDSKFFTATANLAYAMGIMLILATFVLGKEVGGSKSWIPLGFMNIQPVEVCKIFTSLALAKFMSLPETNFHKTKTQLIAAAIAFTPAILSVLQKEPGAAIVYFSFAIAFYREGLPTLYLIIIFSLAILIVASIVLSSAVFYGIITIGAFLFIFFTWRRIRRDMFRLFLVLLVWLMCVGVKLFVVPALFEKVLKPHQVVRIFSTFGIDDYKFKSAERTADIQKEFAKLGTTKKKAGEKVESYNVKQSKIAIGSGGFWGKGFLQGTQTRGEFVPAQNTDFIFSSVGENFGFWGCAVLMLLYFGLMLRMVLLAERQRSTFSRVYMYCVVGILFFHVALNVCMTLGLAPSPGITLPLLSYGGSSLVTFTILIFICIKLDADRQMILR
ncbi:MAG: rod shape-determining protein RodA [Ferruginibacter sp.]